MVDEIAPDDSMRSNNYCSAVTHTNSNRDIAVCRCVDLSTSHRHNAMLRYDGWMSEQATPVLSSADLAEVFGPLSNPTRLAILGWLRAPGSFPPQDRPAAEV